ncbi:uncharacterized protein LOC124916531 [Impatiens glandulifera]|uniref:uncharacterized protein LOC124916531 n=1 Tax=Impatiens glandulifera TaxID=253017 RepID=UPI001FB1321A|nr:uncharacterized protein LOC124916531 [Impatiens glandulifera]
MWSLRWWRKRLFVLAFMLLSALFASFGLLILTLRSVDFSPEIDFPNTTYLEGIKSAESPISAPKIAKEEAKRCATVEEMGDNFGRGSSEENLRVRKIIQRHFDLNGASRVRDLPPEQFCRHGFVLGKASEAGFGNEMYKILTGAALSIMFNRSLIIGQTRDKYPFGDYISYSNVSFTLREVKHLWRHNGCFKKFGRHLNIRTDDFLKPTKTGVLCSNWKEWKQPIIWLQNTTDAVAAQFFLKNVHAEIQSAAFNLFGEPGNLSHRPNVFGELMRVLISPSIGIEEAVNWVIGTGPDPDITLHMRMLMNKSPRAVHAAVNCIKKAVHNLQISSKPKVVLVSDTPSLISEISQSLGDFAEVIHFDYKMFGGNMSMKLSGERGPDFRVKDWGPAPRWVAFVDFFLASRARYSVVAGAHRRVGTTFAQLVAALAAANRLSENFSAGSDFLFLSSFQSNLLSEGLKNQIGWGHVWNRFSGPLSCRNQPNQCALTPFLPPAWWDGLWQSPIPRDINRMQAYGVRLSGFGTFDDSHLQSFCNSRKKQSVNIIPII